MQIDWLLIIEVSKALLTPLIAVVAAYIAWQQWKTNELKVKMDRYDRRFRIYEEVKRTLSIIFRDADIGVDELLMFRTKTSEADFLFGPEISAYIETIYKSGVALSSCNRQARTSLEAAPGAYDPVKNSNEMHKQLTWLTDQFEPAKNIFKPYLDING